MELPVADDAAMVQSERLCARIRVEIELAGGQISFARFMELALYEPGLGYYVAGARKFGEQGDFVTAPELGDLFARCLARQCEQVLQECGGDILEFGAGSGILAANLLRALKIANSLPERYLILEISPDLQARQRATLQANVPDLIPRVTWSQTLPDRFCGVMLANEVLDAMPVQRFRVKPEGPVELAVAAGAQGFYETERNAEHADGLRVAEFGLPDDYVCELHNHAQAWLRSVLERLERGVLLLLDYGFPAHEYYHPQRALGTLMCHYRHRAHHDPYINVGLQDITVHIDFSALANIARDLGVKVMGYTQLAPFLMSLGLLEFAQSGVETTTRKQMEIAQQVKKLTLSSEMGELFKVLALARDMRQPLIGFSMQDHRNRL